MNKVRIGVKIMPRDVILDTQGRAIEQTLKLNSLPSAQVRVGRFVELELEVKPGGDLVAAKKEAEQIARKVLCNPLIESFELKEM